MNLRHSPSSPVWQTPGHSTAQPLTDEGRMNYNPNRYYGHNGFQISGLFLLLMPYTRYMVGLYTSSFNETEWTENKVLL